MNSTDNIIVKGFCPSLEKPMISGDGWLVRVPLRFGRARAETLHKIAGLSQKYGNGLIDLSARGNLQLRGVSEASYPLLRDELKKLGFEKDAKFAVIANPLDEKAQQAAENLYSALEQENICLPEKYLIVIDGGDLFSLAALPCDYYARAENFDVGEAVAQIKTAPVCNKRVFAPGVKEPSVGFIGENIFCAAAKFGRISAENLHKLAGIAEKYAGSEVVFAPFRRVLLPLISSLREGVADEAIRPQQQLKNAGFITESNSPYLNIHACVGLPTCSSALGETFPLAKKYAVENPDSDKIVHITGCAKGCAYHGRADIVIVAQADNNVKDKLKCPIS